MARWRYFDEKEDVDDRVECEEGFGEREHMDS